MGEISMFKKVFFSSLLLGLMVMQCAIAADRVVLFEHFTEDGCAWCPQVAAAVETLYNSVQQNRVAIISYSIRGSQAVPEGSDRLDDYGKSTAPQVFGDGVADMEDIMPVEASDLTSYFNSRVGTPSPLTICVFKESNSQYRIHITAETAVSGSLMAVAYEDITHDGSHYPKFARQILTDYWGDSFSIGAGESQDIVKTVSIQSGWNPANMGVIAWVHQSTKSQSRRFVPHESIQAADSAFAPTNPTPTPTSPTSDTPTPTPTSGDTPTPTPTFAATDLQQSIELSSNLFYPGDTFRLDIHTQNPATESVTVDQYIALQVLDLFYFWPAWSDTADSAQRTFSAGYDGAENIFNFVWPEGTGSFDNIWFWLASLKVGTAELAGPYDSENWGYTQ